MVFLVPGAAPAAGPRRLPIFGQLHEHEDERDRAEVIRNASALALATTTSRDLLIVAEQSFEWAQWLAAAQCFVHVLFRTASRPPTANGLDELREAITLARRTPVELRSATDLWVYCVARISTCLLEQDIPVQQHGKWICDGLWAAAAQRPGESWKSNLVAHFQRIKEPDDGRPWSKADCILAREVSGRLLYRSRPERPYAVNTQARRRLAAFLFLYALIGLAAVAIIVSNTIPWPPEPLMLGVVYLPLKVAVVAWPLLLVTTWIYAYLDTGQAQTRNVISPLYYMHRNYILVGEIVPFLKDWFYHIFQFIWIPALVSVAYLALKMNDFPKEIAHIWNLQDADMSLTQFLTLQDRAAPWWQVFLSFIIQILAFQPLSLACAAGGAVWAVRRQLNIQKERCDEHTTLYWWDRRISGPVFLTRLVMVGVDIFFAIILAFNIAMVALVAYKIVVGPKLSISYFSADGAGGLDFVTGVLSGLTWLVFIFGLFVIASLYMHRKLREYRNTSIVLVLAYLAMVSIISLAVLIVSARLERVKTALIGSLPPPPVSTTLDPDKPKPLEPKELEDAAKRIRDINTIRDWRASAFRIGFLDGPLGPLLPQLAIIVLQFFFRSGSGAKTQKSDDSTFDRIKTILELLGKGKKE